MHDSTRLHKKSKDITFDAGSRDVFYDPGVPSSTAAGSRDPDPSPLEEDQDEVEVPPPPLPPPKVPARG